jgi:hypothetical protein
MKDRRPEGGLTRRPSRGEWCFDRMVNRNLESLFIALHQPASYKAPRDGGEF